MVIFSRDVFTFSWGILLVFTIKRIISITCYLKEVQELLKSPRCRVLVKSRWPVIFTGCSRKCYRLFHWNIYRNYPTNARLFKGEMTLRLWENIAFPFQPILWRYLAHVIASKMYHLLKQSSLFLLTHPSKRCPPCFLPIPPVARGNWHPRVENDRFGSQPKRQKSGGEWKSMK